MNDQQISRTELFDKIIAGLSNGMPEPTRIIPDHIRGDETYAFTLYWSGRSWHYYLALCVNDDGSIDCEWRDYKPVYTARFSSINDMTKEFWHKVRTIVGLGEDSTS